MMTAESNTPLPRWAYVSLAAIVAAIGLASSVVTAKFFVLGLERIESDALARDLLIATGMLMIATELVAFGMAALLPKHQLRSLRIKLIICGTLLLGFEATTIYITQVALMQTAEASVTANNSRVQDLRTSIDQRRMAAKSLRDNGALQSASSNSWTRTLGAAALRDALKVERDIEPLSTELAQLQSTAHPSMTAVLGANGMLIYSVARAVLISAMGLIMFAAAGALLREARGNGNKAADASKPNNLGGGRPVTLAVPSVRYSVPSLAAPAYSSPFIASKVVHAAPVQPQASFDLKGDTDVPVLTKAVQAPVETQPTIASARCVPPSSLKAKRDGLSKLIAEGWCRKIPETSSLWKYNVFMQNA